MASNVSRPSEKRRLERGKRRGNSILFGEQGVRGSPNRCRGLRHSTAATFRALGCTLRCTCSKTPCQALRSKTHVQILPEPRTASGFPRSATLPDAGHKSESSSANQRPHLRPIRVPHAPTFLGRGLELESATPQNARTRNGLIVLNKLNLAADGLFEMRLSPCLREMTAVVSKPPWPDHQWTIDGTGFDFQWMCHDDQLLSTEISARKLLMVVIRLKTGPMSANTSWAYCGSGST